MAEQDKTNWYKNGKFTAITSLIILIFGIAIWTIAFLIYVLHPNVVEHQFLKDTLYNIMWYFGFGIGSFCVAALFKRGWTFLTTIFKKKQENSVK